jgi:hypothetical protein
MLVPSDKTISSSLLAELLLTSGPTGVVSVALNVTVALLSDRFAGGYYSGYELLACCYYSVIKSVGVGGITIEAFS